MEDISQEGETSSQTDSSVMEMDSLSSQDAKAIYEREARILIDYSNLDDDLKEASIFFSCRLLLF